MKKLLLFLIRFYRKHISPAFPPSCRFTPTCSAQHVPGFLEHRDALVEKGECDAYPVDEGLLAKLQAGYHEPAPEEIDVLYENNWVKL